jgi:DNA N-6-adenine-methyltransferase (Dam)
MARRGIHTRPNHGLTDDWITPPELIHTLGEFDTDPCAHPEQLHRTARTMIAPPADGLAETWRGRVWLNPPYGGRLRHWLARLVKHGNGIALVPARTDVESWFWPFVWEAADAILFIRGRLYFHRPDGTTIGNAGHGSVLAAYGLRNVSALSLSGIEGRLIRQR